MSSYVAKKLCNVLIEDAQEDFSLATNVADVLGIDFNEDIISSVLDTYKEAYGGLWVGGTVLLTNTEIMFTPNAMNNAFHKGDNSVTIPLSLITSVEDEYGFITKIVKVTTKYGIFKIRCFGAKKFRELISQELSRKNA